MEAVAVINQESIPGLGFYQDEVCEGPEEKVTRLRKLKKATILGNGSRNPVKLTFKCARGGEHTISTVIRAVQGRFVALGEGVTIPINSIKAVEFNGTSKSR